MTDPTRPGRRHALEFRILGQLEVLDGERRLDLGGDRQRALLAALLLGPNRPTPSERLIDAVWDGRPPPTAAKALQASVSRLRKALGKERIHRDAGGYALRVSDQELDSARFERLAGEGRLREALELWRGAPLAEFAGRRFAQAEIGRLTALHSDCLERLEHDVDAARADEVACPSCGRHNPAAFRFCGACGRPLGPAAPPARSERKVVTVLFIDLVGFTARAELMDPEDVAELLASYRIRITAELERFGGTLEKFVGDGAMAVFGAPLAHEDDAERAIRAAVAIREAAGADGVDVRIGVNTGEALVTIPGSAHEELSAAGDVVNTASRLEGAAPVNGILVGRLTYEATREVVEYSEAEAVRAKGKREPVAAWEVVSVRGEVGAPLPHSTPLVGRRDELDRLHGALDEVRASDAPALVTLVGGPGFGKSRLVHEFRERTDAVWRQGRCVPYGSGLIYGVLGEIVRSHAGIADADAPPAAADRLRRAVREAIADESDAAWVEEHLRPLAGLGGEGGGRRDRKAEAFFAWRRFLEAVAAAAPLVLVLEDLHWADDDLLDFVEHLLDWATGVPLLVLCTARPELLDRRPGWDAGRPNRSVLRVAALPDDDVARLVSALLGRASLSADVQSALLGQAAGNPLYAEQYTRLFLERGLDAPPPPTLQALIAARLDALAPEDKELLQTAAVAGRSFSSSCVASVERSDRWTVEERLRALERKELVRRAAAVASDGEWAFGHALIRDAAYGQIRRAERAEKHRLTAEWIESIGRGEEQAETVAHHYVAALELTGAPALVDRARLALRRAADRARALNAFSTAARLYEEALELWPVDDPERPSLQLEHGRSLYRASGSGTEALLAARDGLLAAGQGAAAAEAEIVLAELASYTGEHERASEHLERALRLAEDEPPSWPKGFVISRAARLTLIRAELDAATRLAQEALELAGTLGLEEIRIHALNTLGTARVQEGDPAGLEDVEESLRLARRVNSPEIGRGYLNLSVVTAMAGDLERSLAVHEEGLHEAERLGAGGLHRFLRGHRAQYCYWSGRWDEAIESGDAFLAEVDAGSPHYEESQNRNARALILLARGDLTAALEDTRLSQERARQVKDLQVLLPTLAVRSFALLTAGDADAARRLAREVLEHWRGVEDVVLAWGGVAALDTFAEVDPKLVQARHADGRPWVSAATAYLAGDFEAAAEWYARIGSRPDEARARLRAAERLAAAGDPDAAERQRNRALSFARAVGAAAWAREAERLLAVSA